MAAVTEPLPFRLLVDEAMKLTRRHFRQMFVPVALPIALAQSVVPVSYTHLTLPTIYSV